MGEEKGEGRGWEETRVDKLLKVRGCGRGERGGEGVGGDKSGQAAGSGCALQNVEGRKGGDAMRRGNAICLAVRWTEVQGCLPVCIELLLPFPQVVGPAEVGFQPGCSASEVKALIPATMKEVKGDGGGGSGWSTQSHRGQEVRRSASHCLPPDPACEKPHPTPFWLLVSLETHPLGASPFT